MVRYKVSKSLQMLFTPFIQLIELYRQQNDFYFDTPSSFEQFLIIAHAATTAYSIYISLSTLYGLFNIAHRCMACLRRSPMPIQLEQQTETNSVMTSLPGTLSVSTGKLAATASPLPPTNLVSTTLSSTFKFPVAVPRPYSPEPHLQKIILVGLNCTTTVPGEQLLVFYRSLAFLTFVPEVNISK